MCSLARNLPCSAGGPLRASSPTSSLTPFSGRSLCWLYKGKKEISIYGVLTVYLALDIGPERVSDVG